MRLGVDPDLVAAVVELWRDPAPHLERLAAGEALSVDALLLPEAEAAARAESPDSTTALLAIPRRRRARSAARSPDRGLDGLPPSAQRRLVDLSERQSSASERRRRNRQTVVALHRARAIAEQGERSSSPDHFVNTLPRVWEGLFATFAPAARASLDIRTVDAVAYDIYRDGGGWAEPADASWLEGVVREVHGDDADTMGGLSSIALADEFNYVITGRGVTERDAYLALPRTGRGSPLSRSAREEVWRRYEDLSRAPRRGSAVRVSRDPRRGRSNAGGGGRTSEIRHSHRRRNPGPDRELGSAAGGARGRRDAAAVTFVGDGQQSIYPGGFSLRSLGVDVRGRSFLLRTNWRNTYAIWVAASAFIAGDAFDDLEDTVARREDRDQPYPLRDGAPPRLHELASPEEAAEWLAALVAEDLEAGADPADCAVLAPTNALAAKAERALSVAKVPVRRLDQYAGEHGEAVWCGTFHRGKGLEFKRVYVVGLDAASWPPRLPGLETEAQREADERAVTGRVRGDDSSARHARRGGRTTSGRAPWLTPRGRLNARDVVAEVDGGVVWVTGLRCADATSPIPADVVTHHPGQRLSLVVLGELRILVGRHVYEGGVSRVPTAGEGVVS